MIAVMLSSIRKEVQILQSVIELIFVDVMHTFRWFQKATQKVLNKQYVFLYAFASTTIRMIRRIDKTVPLRVDVRSFEIGMMLSCTWTVSSPRNIKGDHPLLNTHKGYTNNVGYLT